MLEDDDRLQELDSVIRRVDNRPAFPPKLIRQVWATLIVFAVVLLALGGVVVTVLAIVSHIETGLNNGTGPGNKSRAITCQLYIEMDFTLPAPCLEPEVSALLVPKSEVTP